MYFTLPHTHSQPLKSFMYSKQVSLHRQKHDQCVHIHVCGYEHLWTRAFAKMVCEYFFLIYCVCWQCVRYSPDGGWGVRPSDDYSADSSVFITTGPGAHKPTQKGTQPSLQFTLDKLVFPLTVASQNKMSGSILTEARFFNQGENKTIRQQQHSLLSAVQTSASIPLVSSPPQRLTVLTLTGGEGFRFLNQAQLQRHFLLK